MARRSSRSSLGPMPTFLGRLPAGPARPQRRPASWAAGMAPFGRHELSLAPGISGGQLLPIAPTSGVRRARRALPGA